MLKSRIIPGLFLVLFGIVVFLLRQLTPYIFDAVIFALLILSVLEVVKVLNNNSKKCYGFFPLIYSGVLSLIFVLSLILKLTFVQVLIYNLLTLMVMFSIVFLIDSIKMYKNKETFNKKQLLKKSFTSSLNNLFAIVYPNILFGSLFYINHLNDFTTNSSLLQLGSNVGFLCLVMIFITTITTDTVAFFLGKQFGGVKLAPLISPNKTIAGAVCGFVGGVISSLILFLIFNANSIYANVFVDCNLSPYFFLLYGIVSSIFSQAGDLFASFIKRKENVKDFSNMFAGHGGIMDRFDGESFVAPITLLMFILFI